MTPERAWEELERTGFFQVNEIGIGRVTRVPRKPCDFEYVTYLLHVLSCWSVDTEARPRRVMVTRGNNPYGLCYQLASRR